MKKYIYIILIVLTVGLVIYFFGENGFLASILALLGIGVKKIHTTVQHDKKALQLEKELSELKKEKFPVKDRTDQEVVDYWKNK